MVSMQWQCMCRLRAESEYALWLEAVANGGSYAQLSELLALLAGELNELRHTSLDLVARFFRCARRACAVCIQCGSCACAAAAAPAAAAYGLGCC